MHLASASSKSAKTSAATAAASQHELCALLQVMLLEAARARNRLFPETLCKNVTVGSAYVLSGCMRALTKL